MSDDIQFLANRARVHVSAARTADTFTLIEVFAPAGDQPPLHVHHDSDEAFYVLEGEMTLWVGDETYVLGPGDSAFAPRGIPHTLRTGADGARSLVASTPARFEAFVRAVGAANPGPEELTRIADEHGIEILGPPGMLPSDLAAARA
jgi:quercetin dioxygenase-like cupin family protein